MFESNEFDQWAVSYDQDVLQSGFPFEGYAAVLEQIIRWAQPQPGMRILDLGCGTGALTQPFVDLGCKAWGTDFSPAMLEQARKKVPAAVFLLSDLRQGLPKELDGSFDCIVSAYTLHHFDLPHKMSLIAELFSRLLPGGRLVIGDLSFQTFAERELARKRFGSAWDEEDYWIAEEVLPAIKDKGWQVEYRQISSIAGVYRIQ